MRAAEHLAMDKQEQLSALADGELGGEAFAQAMAWFDGDGQDAAHMRAAWRTLHVVGDVLRREELAVCHRDTAFFSRMQSALQAEARLEVCLLESTNEPVRPKAQHTNSSANEANFRWKWVAGLASVAAVLAVSWNMMGSYVNAGGAQLAQANAPAMTAISPLLVQTPTARNNNVGQVAGTTELSGSAMLRSPELDALLAAHSQLGGSSALQMPSGFLRNATFHATSNGKVP